MRINKKTKILVRFDDICPTMDWNQFERAVELLDKYNIKPLIGIIPDNQDKNLFLNSQRKDFWDIIKSLQDKGYVIAMHGMHHVFDTQVRGNINTSHKSEYAGHSIDIQKKKIQEGIKILNLHGIKTDIFFAPAHSFDDNTIKALYDLGFKYMSDSQSVLPYCLYGLKLLPTRQRNIIPFTPLKYTTAIFHAHEWALPNKSSDYDLFRNLIINNSQNIVEFSEFANVACGNLFIQRFYEKFYVIYERHVRPWIVKIYKIVNK